MKAFFTISGIAVALMWIVAILWVPGKSTSALLCLNDVRNPANLVTHVQDDSTSFSAYLRANLSDHTRKLLKPYVPGTQPDPQIVRNVVYDLNEILQDADLADKRLLTGLDLSPATRRLAIENPYGVQRIFMNRRILDDAFFNALSPLNLRKKMTTLSWSTDPNPVRQEQLAPFQALHCDLAVTVEPVTYDKIIVQCSSGVGPDLIEIYNKEDMTAYVDAGILMDLTPYAKQYGFSPDVTFPQLRGNILVDGRQYRFPCNVGNQVLIYNKEIFAKAGIPLPTDNMEWGEFIKRIQPLTVKRPDGYGYEQFAMLMDQGYAKDIQLQFGGQFFSEDRTKCVLDSPESIDGVRFYNDLIHKYHLIPSATDVRALASAGGWGTGEIRWFAAGRGAVLWGARWMIVQFRQYPNLNGKLGVAFLPHVKGRKTACYCGTRGTGINVNSPNREAALQFMKYLASNEYNRQIGLDGDGLPPNAAFARNPNNLMNPKYPWETKAFQTKFVQAMDYAHSPEISPFVDPHLVTTIWTDALDEVTNEIKTPEQAMHDAAKRINDLIRENIQDRPDLKALYEKIKSGSNPQVAAEHPNSAK